MDDLISRQSVIDALNVGAELLRRVLDDADIVGAERAKYEWGLGLIESYISDMKELPSAQPERLTDDDFETIRIHLNAYKEKLCNQHRWEEADEYQRIIDRFMAFASTQPEIIRCKDCKFWMPHSQFGYDEDNGTYHDYCAELVPEDEYYAFYRNADDFCSRAERRTSGN